MKEKMSGIGLTWLGQAGFLVESGGCRAVIDPYLSDSLYEKYRDSKFPHQRMMEPPLRPKELKNIDLVLCTHGHTDHMDPGTLPAIAEANPDCVFICPASEQQKAVERGVPADRITGLDEGGLYVGQTGCSLSICAIASAHEQLELDEKGRNLYLGYVIDAGGFSIYHSGDCVPYQGLAEKLKGLKIDLALLPVNGRDEYRTSNGIAGNFTLEEAAALCTVSGIPAIVPHHFGMFDFNTEDPARIKKLLSETNLKFFIPEPCKIYDVTKKETYYE